MDDTPLTFHWFCTQAMEQKFFFAKQSCCVMLQPADAKHLICKFILPGKAGTNNCRCKITQIKWHCDLTVHMRNDDEHEAEYLSEKKTLLIFSWNSFKM